MHPQEPVLFVVGIVVSVVILVLSWEVNRLNRARRQADLPLIRPIHRALVVLWAVLSSAAAVFGGLVNPDTFRERDEHHHSS